jgi:hypothetical protein
MKYKKFMEKHKKYYQVLFDFSEYYRAKKAAKAEGSGMDATGKPVPTPNQIVRCTAKKFACESAVKSHLGGNVQELLIADEQQFLALLRPDQIAQRGAGGSDPNSTRFEIADGDAYVAFAQRCGLL